MEASFVPFPLGGYQGLPCLKCRIVDPTELGLELIDEMRARSNNGVQLLWLVTDLWGHDAWDKFLINLVNDTLFGEMPLVAIRSGIESAWSNIGLQWVIDITQTFSKPMDAETLRLTAISASAVPVPIELVWIDPPVENLTIGALEALHDYFGPSLGSWIYTDDESLAEQAFRYATRAAAVWGVRAIPKGKHWTAI